MGAKCNDSLNAISKHSYAVSKDMFSISKDQIPVSEDPVPVSEEGIPISKDMFPTPKDIFPVSKDMFPVSNVLFPISNQVYPISQPLDPVSEQVNSISNAAEPVRDAPESSNSARGMGLGIVFGRLAKPFSDDTLLESNQGTREARNWRAATSPVMPIPVNGPAIGRYQPYLLGMGPPPPNCAGTLL